MDVLNLHFKEILVYYIILNLLYILKNLGDTSKYKSSLKLLNLSLIK